MADENRIAELVESGVLARVPQCPICGESDRTPAPDSGRSNHYLDALSRVSDLTGAEAVELCQVYLCRRCDTQYCDPWLSLVTSSQLYTIGFGQHVAGWKSLEMSLLGAKSRWKERAWQEIQAHLGPIDTYAEVNCALFGLLPYLKELEWEPAEYRRRYEQQRRDLRAKDTFRVGRLSGWMRRIRALGERGRGPLAQSASSSPNGLPRQRYLIHQRSTLCWGVNCVANGVTCNGVASALLDAPVVSLAELEDADTQIDAALLTTFDHDRRPMLLLDRLLARTRLVMVMTHSWEHKFHKQHAFAFGPGFANYLRSRGLKVEEARERVLPPDLRKKYFYLLISRDVELQRQGLG
jgi:hypothetical protein